MFYPGVLNPECFLVPHNPRQYSWPDQILIDRLRFRISLSVDPVILNVLGIYQSDGEKVKLSADILLRFLNVEEIGKVTVFFGGSPRILEFQLFHQCLKCFLKPVDQQYREPRWEKCLTLLKANGWFLLSKMVPKHQKK